MERKVAQLNNEGFYLYAATAYGRGMPGNAREAFPPETPLPEHHRWRWFDGAYTATPDYRGQTVYRPDGTTYHPNTWGPLPEGDSLDAPPPPPPTLAEALAAKLADVMGSYSAAFADLEKIYPTHEREGWPLQEAEALALQADPDAPTPVLSALVQLRAQGESVADLAARVLANAATWRQVYAWYTGQQQRMYAEVSALTDVEAIQAYQVTYAPPPEAGGA